MHFSAITAPSAILWPLGPLPDGRPDQYGLSSPRPVAQSGDMRAESRHGRGRQQMRHAIRRITRTMRANFHQNGQ